MRTFLTVILLSYSVQGSAETFEESVTCLTQNIYFEARNQSVKGQYAVGFVTINRLKHKNYPNSVCKVVWQPKQFSWTHDGKPDNPYNHIAWLKAKSIAIDILSNGGKDVTKGALFYHADYVKPRWANSFQKISQIDDHVFYR